MNSDFLIVTLIVGIGTWALRYLPSRIDMSSVTPGGPVSRFLEATGPAAIAALCVAAFLPMVEADMVAMIKLAAGLAGTFLGFKLSRDMSVAAIAGAAGYALAFWLL